jgi:hypothetical protein
VNWDHIKERVRAGLQAQTHNPAIRRQRRIFLQAQAELHSKTLSLYL